MKQITILFLALCLLGCRDNFDMELRDNDLSLLVVEGVLNTGQGPTTITLSKTVKVNDTAVFQPMLGAQLVVEARNGGTYNLASAGSGNYTHPQLPLVLGQEYRLRIQVNNKEYLSDYVVARKTPEIDSISWKRQPDGLSIYANTHDPANASRYYRWDYDETWEINSFYSADYRWVTDATIVPEWSYNDTCWKYSRSTNINIGSTAHLQSDVISEAKLVFIPLLSDKLSVRYSILVKQQSLTKAAYEFYKLMQSNTESIGTIFDPQPAELLGNIKCVSNPDETVIGFLSATSFTEKRIFITYQQANWRFPQTCEIKEVVNHPDSIRKYTPGFLPFEAIFSFGNIIAYQMAFAPCVDCTKRGGQLNRPSFW